MKVSLLHEFTQPLVARLQSDETSISECSDIANLLSGMLSTCRYDGAKLEFLTKSSKGEYTATMLSGNQKKLYPNSEISIG